MDRVSGGFKRFAQCFTLAAGVVAAVGLNINSIRSRQYLVAGT
jgi:hypothetical protein